MSSETAHFLIFGYELEEFPGRGYLEAIGRGIPVKSNEIAVLCHICCVENNNNNLFLTWGRPEISQEEAHMLINAIQSFEANKVKINLIPSRGIDGFLILSGAVSERITDSDPDSALNTAAGVGEVPPGWEHAVRTRTRSPIARRCTFMF